MPQQAHDTATFKKFSHSDRLDEPVFHYAHDHRFKGFLKLLASMLPEHVTPATFVDICEDLLSVEIREAEEAPRRQRDSESLITRLIVFMQGCPPATPKLFSDAFTNKAITLFAVRYLLRRGK